MGYWQPIASEFKQSSRRRRLTRSDRTWAATGDFSMDEALEVTQLLKEHPETYRTKRIEPMMLPIEFTYQLAVGSNGSELLNKVLTPSKLIAAVAISRWTCDRGYSP